MYIVIHYCTIIILDMNNFISRDDFVNCKTVFIGTNYQIYTVAGMTLIIVWVMNFTNPQKVKLQFMSLLLITVPDLLDKH